MLILIYFGIIVLLFLTMVLHKKIHYAISGTFLLALGILPLLYNARIINFNIESFGIMRFIAYFFVIFAAKDLFKEGFQEENIKLKIPTLLFAIFLLIFTTIPTLNNMNILIIDIPKYPDIINHVIYIISGLFLLIGIFTLVESD